MKLFDLEIRYPKHSHPDEAERFMGLDPQTILAHFDALNLRKLQIQQLELDGPSTSIKVTDQETGQSCTLSLNAFSEEAEYQFKLESNIDVVIPHKNLFGLLTVNAKHRVHHKQIPCSQAREYLNYLVHGHLDKFKAVYLVYHNTPKASKV
jgi:hypothetical protein